MPSKSLFSEFLLHFRIASVEMSGFLTDSNVFFTNIAPVSPSSTSFHVSLIVFTIHIQLAEITADGTVHARFNMNRHVLIGERLVTIKTCDATMKLLVVLIK